MPINSRNKGKVGEREWAEMLRSFGFDARRGVQHSGSPDSPDVVCPPLSHIHWEVKRVQSLNIHAAIRQAKTDCGSKWPIVAHRRNNEQWLVTLPAEILLGLLGGKEAQR